MNDRLSPAACEPLEARRLLAGTPYLGTPFALGGGATRVEAEHFDLGGEGVAFHDNDPAWNFGDGRLRPEGVDVRTDPAGLVVGWTRRGEWLEYSLSAAAAGRYAVKLRAAATVSLAGAGISLSVDGRSVGDYALPATKGGFALYDGVTAELAAGPHVLRATFTRPAGQDDIGVADLDYLELSKAGGNGPAQSPFGGAPVTLGSGTARVEAERYDLGGEGVAFHDNDPNYNAGDGRFGPRAWTSAPTRPAWSSAGPAAANGWSIPSTPRPPAATPSTCGPRRPSICPARASRSRSTADPSATTPCRRPRAVSTSTPAWPPTFPPGRTSCA